MTDDSRPMNDNVKGSTNVIAHEKPGSDCDDFLRKQGQPIRVEVNKFEKVTQANGGRETTSLELTFFYFYLAFLAHYPKKRSDNATWSTLSVLSPTTIRFRKSPWQCCPRGSFIVKFSCNQCVDHVYHSVRLDRNKLFFKSNHHLFII
jgi:hypothetical protein